ncbi:MAG: pdhD, partial [Chloroflexi bacterium]|nr:pdhD [Chloroflexota bacterium]
EEPEVARELARSFARKGVICQAGAAVERIERASVPLPSRLGEGTSSDAGLSVVATVDGSEAAFPVDTVLMAVGRRPNVGGLNLEAAGVVAEPRFISTDANMRTNVPNIFAVGDVTGRFLLAHVASHQGIVAAETIAGHGDQHRFDERIIPGAIFTHPEIASVGLRERQADELGIPTTIGRFPFAAIGRPLASGESGGFVKLIAHAETRVLLGAHIVGPSAGDLIAEAALAMRLNATIDDLAATIHVHPTFSEAMLEAAWATLGTPVHIPRSRPRRAAGD